MPTRSRVRRTMDFGRLREALSGPGADPRTWVTMARVDDDPDAIRWEAGTGWVADVTFLGGQLAEEGPIPCRVSAMFGGPGRGKFEPVTRGCEVIVVLPEGDANAGPIIVGYLANPTDCAVPTEVNGEAIDEAKVLAAHVLVTPHSVDEQVGGGVRTTAVEDHVLTAGGTVQLGEENLVPTEGVVQGEGIDPFTGLTYFALGNASAKVLAKK